MTKNHIYILAIGFSFTTGHSQDKKSSLFNNDSIASFSFKYKPFTFKQNNPDFFPPTSQLQKNIEGMSSIENTYSILIVEPEGHSPMPNFYSEDKTKRSLVVIAPK